MLFDSQPGTPWAEGEARTSKLVFIGKGLAKIDLAAGFKSCLASNVTIAVVTQVPTPHVVRPAAADEQEANDEEMKTTSDDKKQTEQQP